MRHAKLVLLAAAGLAASCGHVGERHPLPVPPNMIYTVSIWVDDSPDLSKKDVRAACDLWKVKAVSCVMTENPGEADIRVFADKRACKPDKKGYVTLAVAYKGGLVMSMSECFRQSDKKIDSHKFTAVMAHEVGHQLGIWDHVPEQCDGKAKKHPNGKPVCGLAIMNAYYKDEIDYVTAVDGLAFDLRDLDYAVVSYPAGRDNRDSPDCVYYGR